jgi:SAM-dependent methyltransferase
VPLQQRAAADPTIAPPASRPRDPFFDRRLQMASDWLRGDGIELGALNQPLEVSLRARVRYVDRFPTEQLRAYYAGDMDPATIVPIDIVDDGELLATIEDDRFDFVIANHFLEHCLDPLGAMAAMLRVVRLGGVVYLAVPDKRFSFDADRPSTTLEHVLQDHRDGGRASRHGHYVEWASLVLKCDEPVRQAEVVAELEAVESSIHFHAWTAAEFLDLLVTAQAIAPFEIAAAVRNEPETIAILVKTTPQRDDAVSRWNPIDGWHIPGNVVEWP